MFHQGELKKERKLVTVGVCYFSSKSTDQKRNQNKLLIDFRPNSGAYVNVFDAGHYSCVVCDNPVFSSDAKYKSYCGWATFHKPFSDENCVDTAVDTFDGLVRTEVKCSKASTPSARSKVC